MPTSPDPVRAGLLPTPRIRRIIASAGCDCVSLDRLTIHPPLGSGGGP